MFHKSKHCSSHLQNGYAFMRYVCDISKKHVRVTLENILYHMEKKFMALKEMFLTLIKYFARSEKYSCY